ncbi:zincin-like metallopeptidase toxin domain-containing protein [Chryseobacterium nepalense]|jgi:hypothetical protein|nr:methyl-accepting chemotaxis protein [Chryseobacterium nepalense]
MGYWKYEIVHDYDATKLIKEFREENLKLKNSKGTDDEETDFIVYAEKDDHTISLGRVLLIKMSDAMVKYHHEYKGTVDLPEYWAKYIYEQCKNNNTFQYNEDEIAEAFLESIKLQTKFISVSALDVQNFIRKITESISDSFRKDERFSREQWDPTLKSDEYLFAEPEKAFNYFIQKCNSLKKTLKKVKDQLEILKSFKILGKEFKVQSIEDIIKGIDEQIKSIEDISNWLIENRNDIKLKIPFLCGVWNGLVEFVGGFLDLALLAINITVNDLAGGETNLEFLEIREGVEEALGAVLKNPAKVFKDVIEGIKNYKYARYYDPKLNQYQIQHNEGEDLILAIDIIVTIVTIIKGIAKLAKQLSKFVKWINEVLVRGGKGARRVEIALLRRGKYLGQVLDDADFIKIESYLKQLKVELQIGKGAGAFEVEGFFLKSGNPLMLEAHNAAMFVTDGVKMKLILRENATIYETLHELMHMRDCQQIGMKAFMQKSLVEREKFVYDKMVEYQKYLNRKELEHAKWYINDRYHKYGVTDNLGNPIKETLPSNLDDIPKKRQKVNLDIILNLK